VPSLLIDAEVELREISNQAAEEALELQPFGAGNPRPLFAARGVEIAAEPVWMKEKHARLVVRQDGRSLRLKAWNFLERAAELVPGRPVDIVFEIEEDAQSKARGYPGWSATLRDLSA
jgi:single-stranded-DNA-specific exonuclease